MSLKNRVAAATFTIGGEELAVITVPAIAATHFDQLTGAENGVCRLVLAGLSNARIAEVRRTSVRTVGNQISAIYRKLGVVSRSELAALWRGRKTPL